ncbi:uncharacterized protein TM35_000061790 [Trypanosoma theileri]|uniref:Uncharacterized protein n=1 Tax=Trypanosoma theileri TaxID=67003 RepID=A0A1X0P2K3_9TRYP|nr:uncharacterized protein TM35_000061790 [Trypanosoma theileri]ORC91174.1 hypothetical protein TM35_000061790 [Trypanosoma theileri]
MSKAAYMMQDQLRRNYALITDVHSPNVFLVRGCLSFPQGLAALTLLFRGKLAADVYSHPYFIEKQSNPSQPSPQLHLTEECQSLMKMIKGLHFMKDDSSKLDNTMVFVTDYSVMARGKMLTLTSEEEDATELMERNRRNGESEKEWQERLLRLRWQKTASNRRNNNQSVSSGISSAESSLRPFTRQSHLANDQQITSEKPHRFVERDGAHTVLYNPIDTDPKTFDATIRKLNDEERVVKTIVVPTRQGWGSVRIWAEAFPDACILCSGDAGRHTNTQKHQQEQQHLQNQVKVHRAGGCIDMGNGVTGLSFPEVDEDELVNSEDGATPAVYDSENICSLYSHQLPVNVRHNADDELRCSPRLEALGTVEQRQITPNIELLRIAGDDQTNEYILYDHSSEALACTDLFHGEYSDLDPVNSWMCRVWFKFMKGGDYKRVDVVPQFKWLHVKQHGDLGAVHESIEMLTKTRPIKYLLYAHGTPPRTEDPANALRLQWGMSPLEKQHQKGHVK